MRRSRGQRRGGAWYPAGLLARHELPEIWEAGLPALGTPPPAPSSSFCHALKGAVRKRSQTSPSSRGWRGQAASTLIGFYKFAEDPAE